MIKLYANPYDITAHGWYFSTAEDFEKKFKKHLPVEDVHEFRFRGTRWVTDYNG